MSKFLKKLWINDKPISTNWKNMHLVGVGGIGMQGLARWLLQLGYTVSGSDDAKFLQNNTLLQAKHVLGEKFDKLKIYRENDTPLANCYIFSSGITANHSQYIYANLNNISCFHRTSVLQFILKNFNTNYAKKIVSITGTHGKGTVTALLTWILHINQYNPSFYIGATLRSLNTSAYYNINDENLISVIEADESDGSMLNLRGNIQCITNIDTDHLDFYGDLNNFKEYMKRYASQCNVGVCNVRDKSLVPKGWLTYSIDKLADITATNIRFLKLQMMFDIHGPWGCWKNVILNQFGTHSIENALAAVGLSYILGLSKNQIIKGLHSFLGTYKRMESYNIRGVTWIHDYAHHPTAIKLMINSLKIMSNVYVVCEIHKYTRFEKLHELFVNALQEAKKVLILPVYSAGTVSKKYKCDMDVFLYLKKYLDCEYIDSELMLEKWCIANLLDKDVILFVGAGNIYSIGRNVQKKFENSGTF